MLGSEDGPTGGCLCGAIRYRLSQKPTGISICHCSMCQRAGGGAFQIYGNVDKNELTWTKGSPRTAKTSAHARRLFCGDCGTPLIFHYVGEDRWGLVITSLDDGASYTPTRHDGVESRLSWLRTNDDLPEIRTEDDPEFQEAVEKFSH